MLFPFFSFLLQCVLWVLVHIKEFGSKKRLEGTSTEALLSHRKHCSLNASSVVLSLIR